VIAGAVIAVLAGLTILGGLAFFFWRRKQKADIARDAPPPYGDSEKAAELSGASDYSRHTELPAKTAAFVQVYELPGSGREAELEGDSPSVGPSPESAASVPVSHTSTTIPHSSTPVSVM
jgi:LPXTG-motif cell wall-anchored protein